MNNQRSGGKRAAGFTLVEMMVALVLGLLVIGAALMVFRTNQTTYNANEGQNRIQENVRTAYELMARDIRSAGGTACSNGSEVVATTTDPYVNAIQLSPITGTAAEFTVTSSEDATYRTTARTKASVTFDSTQLADARNVFHVNDWVVLCNQRKTFMVKATAVSGTTLSFNAIPFDFNDDINTSINDGVVVARLRSSRWYVANNGRGGSSLYMSSFGTAQEVAEGVSNLAVKFLEGDSYKTTGVNWRAVQAVSLSMDMSGPSVDGRALTRKLNNVVNVRSPRAP